MRKIFFIIILSVFTKGLGQTVPTYTYLFDQKITPSLPYEYYTYGESLRNQSGVDLIMLTGDSHFNNSPRDTFVNYNVPVDLNATSYWFSIWGYITHGGELDDFYNTIPILELIKGSIYNHREGVAYSVLTPNDLSISNLGTTEVCAGEMLNLVATPAGFHPEVYHWQYSLDGGIIWIDVPTNINNVVQCNFSIYDILGDDHVNHFGPIHFRLGYNHVDTMYVNDSDRLLSNNSIQINYSSCAPIVTNLQALPPDCNGDPMKVIVTFDRPLDVTKNEKLKNFQIIKKDGQLTGNQIPEILAFDIANTLQFTYNNVSGLENGKTYSIKYQAFQGTVERGVPQTNLDFLYNDPPPLTFSLVQTDPLCHDGESSLNINVTGGSGNYSYSLDGDMNIPFTVSTVETVTTVNNITTISRSASQPITLPINTKTSYNIKVTDANSCIDKNANE